MERPKSIGRSKVIKNCGLPTNEELGELTVEQRIEFGKKHVEEAKLLKYAKFKIDIQLKQRKDLTLVQKSKLRQELYKEAEEEIHKKIFEEWEGEKMKGLTIGQKIALGEKYSTAMQQLGAAKLKINNSIRARKELSFQQREQLRNELYSKAEEEANKNLFEEGEERRWNLLIY